MLPLQGAVEKSKNSKEMRKDNHRMKMRNMCCVRSHKEKTSNETREINFIKDGIKLEECVANFWDPLTCGGQSKSEELTEKTI